jgi:hypothetical protein
LITRGYRAHVDRLHRAAQLRSPRRDLRDGERRLLLVHFASGVRPHFPSPRPHDLVGPQCALVVCRVTSTAGQGAWTGAFCFLQPWVGRGLPPHRRQIPSQQPMQRFLHPNRRNTAEGVAEVTAAGLRRPGRAHPEQRPTATNRDAPRMQPVGLAGLTEGVAILDCFALPVAEPRSPKRGPATATRKGLEL